MTAIDRSDVNSYPTENKLDASPDPWFFFMFSGKTADAAGVNEEKRILIYAVDEPTTTQAIRFESWINPARNIYGCQSETTGIDGESYVLLSSYTSSPVAGETVVVHQPIVWHEDPPVPVTAVFSYRELPVFEEPLTCAWDHLYNLREWLEKASESQLGMHVPRQLLGDLAPAVLRPV